MMTWQLGKVSVTRIEEQLGFANQPPKSISSASNAKFWSGISTGSCHTITRPSETELSRFDVSNQLLRRKTDRCNLMVVSPE